MTLDQKLAQLDQQVNQHNQRAAQAIAERRMLETQREDVINQLRAEGISDISQLPEEIARLEREVEEHCLLIQSKLEGAS